MTPKFCGRCGQPLRETVKPASLKPDGVMWKIRECASGYGPHDGHHWKVEKEWDEGPRFDPETGEARR